MEIRLLCFDLDGTFLDDRKNIPPANLEALCGAAEKGVSIVPATGRIYSGVPAALRELPFMRWYITSNGAHIYDAAVDRTVSRAEIDPRRAAEFCEYADSLGLSYDCYQNGWGFMTADMLAAVPDIIPDPGVRKLVRDLRTPVPELKRYLLDKGEGVQKLQLYFADLALREKLLRELPGRFPDLYFSSSMPFNIEINSAEATKGQALRRLSALLGLPPEASMALGDGTNDLDMIEAAGLGVAMANAAQELLDAADYITGSNNEGGFAAAVERFVLKGCGL